MSSDKIDEKQCLITLAKIESGDTDDFVIIESVEEHIKELSKSINFFFDTSSNDDEK